MEQLSQSLPLCHLLLPLAGAALYLLICRTRPELARMVVIVNAIGSLLLAGLLIAAWLTTHSATAAGAGSPVRNFQDAEAGSTSPRVAGPALNPAVDGVNLWFLASIPVVVLCVLLAEPAERWQPLPIAAVLAAESAALAVFTVRDILTLCSAFGALALANAVVVGSRGGAGVRTAARMLLLQQLGATILITIGLAGSVVACSQMLGAPHAAPQPSDFNLDRLIDEVQRLSAVSPPAELVWRQLSPWLFLSFLAGCLVWSGAFPFHVTSAVALREADPAGQALLGGVTLKVGAWALLRIALPLFFQTIETMNILSPILFLLLVLWGVLSALYCAVSMLGGRIDETQAAAIGLAGTSRDVQPFPAEGAMVIVLLSISGILSGNESSVIGAALLLVAHMLCWMLYILHRGNAGAGVPAAAGPLEEGGWGTFVLLALAGIPGLALFPGLLLVFVGISASAETILSGLAILLLYWLVIATSGWAWFQQSRESAGMTRPQPLSVRIAAVLLMGAIVLIGVAPVIFTGPIRDGVAAILPQM